MASLCLLFFFAPCLAARSDAAVSITRTSAPFFPFDKDTSPALTGLYVSYAITTSSAIADAWARIENFSGGAVSFPNSTPGANLYHIGPMGAGATRTVFFYITTSAATDVTQTQSHDVTVWSGNPTAGGSQLGRGSFSFDNSTVAGTTYNAVHDAIQAQASKVSSVVTGPTPATLGGIVTLTVSGDTGTTNGPLIFTPATDASWPFLTYKLISSAVSLPDGTELQDTLYQGSYTGPSGAYVGVFKFIAVSAYAAPTYTSPAGYINSGTQLKHVPTDSANVTPLAPPIPGNSGNSVIITTSCTPAVLPVATATDVSCAVSLMNSGAYDVTLDDIDELLPTAPASVTYNSGSSAYNGASLPNPLQSGNAVTWSGQYLVPAGATRTLTFSAHVPNSSGVYTFSAYGHIGTEQIDATALLGDDAKASCTVQSPTRPFLSKQFTPAIIGPGRSATLSFTMTNIAGNAAVSGLSFTDVLPAGLAWSGSPGTPQCGGVLAYQQGSGANNTISFTGGTLAAGPSSCTISAQVTGSIPGSYSNSAANISSSTGLDISGLNASLQVVPAVLRKSFQPNSILTGGSAQLLFTITNAAGNPQQSALAFTDTLPAGLSWSGTPQGAQCGGTLSYGGSQNNVISFSGGTLAAGQGSCTVTAGVTGSKTGSYTNDGGNISGVSASLQNAVTAQTLTVTGLPMLSKSFTPASVLVGQPATLVFTITSSSQSSNADFIDVFPLNLALASPTITNTSTNAGCVAASIYKPGTTIPSSAGDTSLEFAAPKIPANAVCSYTVQVASSLTGSYTNGYNNIIYLANLGNAVTDATLNVVAPNIIVLKSVQSYSDPVHGTVSPRAIPGAQMLYQLQGTNVGKGPADANSVVITDAIPAYTALVVAGTPVAFADGSPSSGLSVTWGGLASLTDDVHFSNDGGVTFSYIPTPGANGSDPAVTHIRVTPRGSFSASDGSNNPSFTIAFKVVVK